MKPDFSEFSYGYAVTEELITRHKGQIVGAPEFPSLVAEGKKGGGYDVKIPIRGVPLFLQFKLCDFLFRRNAKEYKQSLLGLPYYRMHLRPIKHSDQHQLLLDLEDSGEVVYYMAPEFHTPEMLNGHYLARDILQHSAGFSPSDIGALPDDNEHYLAFRAGASYAWLRSDERHRIPKRSLHDVVVNEEFVLMDRRRELGTTGFRALAEKMFEVLVKRTRYSQDSQRAMDRRSAEEIVGRRHPIEAVGYLARTFFDSEVIVLK